MTGENGLFGHGTSLGRIPLLRPARDGDFPQACSSIIARRSVRSRVTRPASFSRAPWRTTGSPRQSADAMRPSSSAKPRAVRSWRILTPPARPAARGPSPRPPARGWGCAARRAGRVHHLRGNGRRVAHHVSECAVSPGVSASGHFTGMPARSPHARGAAARRVPRRVGPLD